MNNEFSLAETKIFVGGIQGSGKTYFCSNTIIPSFHHVVVYAMHPSDFRDVVHPDCKLVIPSNHSYDELERTAKKIKQLALDGKCDLWLIDESDLFLPKNLEQLKQYPNLYDLFLNHRHYKLGYPQVDNKKLKGLAIGFVTRRPQELPTVIVESCEHIFLFAIEGDNVIRKFEDIDRRYKDLIPQLNKDKHNFIHKRVGYAPKVYGSSKIIEEAN